MAKSLMDEIKAALPSRRGFAPWYEALEPGLREEVHAIKREWLAGRLKATKTGLAQTLSLRLKARGVNIGHNGVTRWLEKT